MQLQRSDTARVTDCRFRLQWGALVGDSDSGRGGQARSIATVTAGCRAYALVSTVQRSRLAVHARSKPLHDASALDSPCFCCDAVSLQWHICVRDQLERPASEMNATTLCASCQVVAVKKPRKLFDVSSPFDTCYLTVQPHVQMTLPFSFLQR